MTQARKITNVASPLPGPSSAAWLDRWSKAEAETTGFQAPVVWDHAHLFVGLRPKDDPEQVALSLMNNSEYFCEIRYGGVMRDANLTAVWCPNFYVGTGGAATTAQVKSFLIGGRLGCR